MTTMANITVKKADGTTDIVYTALNPSSGDNVPALWRSETAGAAPALRPTIQMKSTNNGPKTARRIQVDYQYPYNLTDTTTSSTYVKSRIPMTMTLTVPGEVPDSIVAEAVNQMTNLLDSQLFIDSFKIGFAPT